MSDLVCVLTTIKSQLDYIGTHQNTGYSFTYTVDAAVTLKFY